jgi:hypothetical protein
MDEATKSLWARRLEGYSAERLSDLVAGWGVGTPMAALALFELRRRANPAADAEHPADPPNHE